MDLDHIIQRKRPPGILVFDSDGELVFLNKEAGEILKAPPEEIKAALPREVLSFSGKRGKTGSVASSATVRRRPARRKRQKRGARACASGRWSTGSACNGPRSSAT